MQRSLLLISYNFPPLPVPEAFLSVKKLGGLREFAVDVLCLNPYRNQRVDFSLDEYVKNRFRHVIRFDAPRWMDRLYQLPILYRLFSGLSRFPDPMRFLNKRATRCAEAMNVADYEGVVTWSQHHSTHLVGMALKKRHPNLRWIAHFSDPWVDNPYNHLRCVTRFTDARMEREVVEKADRILFTSERTLNLVFRKYPSQWKSKACVIPHAFDSTLYEKGSHTEREPGTILIRHLGNFYGNRSPIHLFKAIQIIMRNDRKILNGVRFEFVGKTDGLRYVDLKNLPPHLVTFFPAVDYVHSLSLMRAADALLVIDAPAAQSVFLPSKLVDYLGAARPLLGLTPPGTSRDLILKAGGLVASPDSPGEIVKMLMEAITQLKKGRVEPSQEYIRVRAQYSVESVSELMRGVL